MRMRTRASSRSLLAAVLLAGVGLLPVLPARADQVEDATAVFRKLDAELRVTGMTFVGSRGADNRFVVRARRASFQPESDLAKIEEVSITSSDRADRKNFEVSCQRGELNVETNDFLAEGDVRGTTGDGRRYSAPWVRYDHDRALLYTDAPVVMEDATGTFSGDGFRYSVKDRSFKLVGNVRVVHTP